MTESMEMVLPERNVRTWWNSVCHPEKGNAQARAKLRRARSPQEALMIPSAVRLAVMTNVVDDTSSRRFSDALDLARVLAHVGKDTSMHPMRAAGWKDFPRDAAAEQTMERPKLSELRFRRLVLVSGEERVSAFVRLVALLDGTVNVVELAYAFRWWDDPDNDIKQRWATEYYAIHKGATTTPQQSSSSPTPTEASEA